MTQAPSTGAGTAAEARAGTADRTGTAGPTAPPAASRHLDALDGVRAVAAFSVLLFHIASNAGTVVRSVNGGRLFNGGQVGVAIFFVLSGLLLYRPWARAVLFDRPSPRTGGYLWKRVLRIFPAYAALIVCFMLTAGRDHVQDVWGWVKLITLTYVYDPNRWWPSDLGPREIGQVWSLSMEVAWYALLPVTAALLAWYARRDPAGDTDVRARRLLRALGGYALIAPVYTVIIFVPRHHPLLGVWLPRYTAWFAAGMALAVISEWARAETPQSARVARSCRTVAASRGLCWLAAGSLFVVAASPLTGPIGLSTPDNAWTAQFHLLVFGLCAVFFVAPVALADRSAAAGFLGSRLMRFLGKISYSVFLWQLIIILAWYDGTGTLFNGNLLVDLPLLTALSVLAGTAGYYLIEAPARRLSRLPGRKGRSPAAI